MLMNLKTLDWDDSMLKVFGIPKDILPKILNCTDNFGIIKETALKGIPITG
jgi:glycerol kinase